MPRKKKTAAGPKKAKKDAANVEDAVVTENGDEQETEMAVEEQTLSKNEAKSEEVNATEQSICEDNEESQMQETDASMEPEQEHVEENVTQEESETCDTDMNQDGAEGEDVSKKEGAESASEEGKKEEEEEEEEDPDDLPPAPEELKNIDFYDESKDIPKPVKPHDVPVFSEQALIGKFYFIHSLLN